MTYPDYDQIPALNFSTLKHMAGGPFNYAYRLRNPQPQTQTMAVGVAVHCMVLEPDQFNSRYAICDMNRNSNAYKDQAALEAEAGRVILKSGEYADICTIAASVSNNDKAVELLTHCTTEAALTWTRADGRACKGRIDAYKLDPKPVLIDFKTTADPVPHAFQRQAYNMAYYAQMAWYAEGMVEALECPFPDVFIIATGNREPYETIVYHVPVEVLARGEELYLGWLDELDACEKSGLFPSRYEGVQELELPAWAAVEESVDFEGLEMVE